MDLRPFMNPSPYTVNEVGHYILNSVGANVVLQWVSKMIFFCYRDQLLRQREHITRLNSRLSSGSLSCPVHERRLKFFRDSCSVSSGFQLSDVKLKPNLSLWPITKDVVNIVNQ